MRIHPPLALVSTVALLCAACSAPLSREEAREALTEVEIATQAMALTSGTIEISTDFTIGQAVERAAEELRDFFFSQLPCAAVSLSGAQLTVEYGAEGDCRYRGQRYVGTHEVQVSSNEEAEVIVEHRWEGLGNGRLEVSGTATVTWSFQELARRVVHDLEWVRLEDERGGRGQGDRVQTPLPGGLETGLEVNGERSWAGQAGHWSLDIRGVQMRWVDPVPEAGSLVLETPFDRQRLTFEFERTGDRRINVTVSGRRRSFDFDVLSPPGG